MFQKYHEILEKLVLMSPTLIELSITEVSNSLQNYKYIFYPSIKLK